MAYFPVDGALQYQVFNVVNWVNQGRSFAVGGSFTTTAGTPSSQLLASNNLVLGYYNGQMLARAVGDGTGRFAGLTAGALVNWDVTSTDTGQAVWNGFIIADADIKYPLPIGTTYPGTILVAVPLGGWTMRQQFMYGGGTPATDIAVVKTAVDAFNKCVPSVMQNPSNTSETIFNY